MLSTGTEGKGIELCPDELENNDDTADVDLKGPSTSGITFSDQDDSCGRRGDVEASAFCGNDDAVPNTEHFKRFTTVFSFPLRFHGGGSYSYACFAANSADMDSLTSF